MECNNIFMKYLITLFSILFLFSCASVPDYEKKNYVRIEFSDSYFLKQTIDPNTIYKMNNFNSEEDKTKLLRVGVGGVNQFSTLPPASEDLSLEKISFDNEVFTGVINSCAAKAASENVDAFLGYTTAAAVGAVSGAAMASAAAAIAGPVALLQIAFAGVKSNLDDQRYETIRRAVYMYACLAENGYQAEPKVI
tara:strand:- start:100 stop:681 length:582 start_codon:yes stop_codon:yes gene_type:complete